MKPILFPVGTKIVSTDVVGTWNAVVVEVKPITNEKVLRMFPKIDGYLYITVGKWADEQKKKPELRQLYSTDLKMV